MEWVKTALFSCYLLWSLETLLELESELVWGHAEQTGCGRSTGQSRPESHDPLERSSW